MPPRRKHPQPSPSPIPLLEAASAPSTPSRRARRATTKIEDPSQPVAGPSRTRKRLDQVKNEDDVDGGSDQGGREKRTRLKKGGSYREVGFEEDEMREGEEDGEGSAVEVDGEEEDDAHRSQKGSTSTPRKVDTNSSLPPDLEPDAEASPSHPERVGSGRGGFSVKGAAAAAARARWAKVRKEKAERGDESDEGGGEKRTRRANPAVKRDNKAAIENVEMGTVVTIKGTEYEIGDDELILDGDEKGDTKMDELGRLLGGREYKLVTFTSESRRDPAKVYALTIDAARACGYSDSLAFLRRCPTILKLSCNPDERQMLIDIGRVTGNLRHRMVTMVAMRNVYKMMGARVIKNGKWVTDDYYEDKALAECEENGFTPNAPAHEDEIVANAMSLMNTQGRPSGYAYDTGPSRAAMTLVPFYTLGGPTTHFAGNGADPWSDAGWGNRRAKMKGSGANEEDWMWRTAVECRNVDAMLKEYREERLKVLDGVDVAKGWVYQLEHAPERGLAEEGVSGRKMLEVPGMERQRSGLSQEVILDDVKVPSSVMTPRPDEEGGVTEVDEDGLIKKPGGEIVLESEEQRLRTKWKHIAGSWEPGVVKAVYEPHTHMPHTPLHTQPLGANRIRSSPYPILTSPAKSTHQDLIRPLVTTRAVQGIASVEYVLDATTAGAEDDVLDVNLDLKRSWDEEVEKRLKEVEEAEEWEREARKRRRNQGPIPILVSS